VRKIPKGWSLKQITLLVVGEMWTIDRVWSKFSIQISGKREKSTCKIFEVEIWERTGLRS
jgi:hypothetical protein